LQSSTLLTPQNRSSKAPWVKKVTSDILDILEQTVWVPMVKIDQACFLRLLYPSLEIALGD
jgi:hypothetical protein